MTTEAQEEKAKEAQTEKEMLREFLSNAPLTPGKVAPDLLGWRTKLKNLLCVSCAGRILARGCSIPQGSTPIWTGQEWGGECVGAAKYHGTKADPGRVADALMANDDPWVDEAIEYCGQIPDNVRHMKPKVRKMVIRWLEENDVDGSDHL